MHFLVISLLAILAGTLLLAKAQKEELGKLFRFVAWFFLVIGFVGFLAGGTCALVHHTCKAKTECPVGMNSCAPGQHPGDKCCPEGMSKNCKDMKCPMQEGKCQMSAKCDSAKMPVPQEQAVPKPAKP